MMKALIDDLLTYSRIDSHVTPFSSVDMNEVVARTLSNLALVIKETRAQVIVGKLSVIIADELQMFQVMMNLIGNPLKFHGPNPPVIRISAEEQGNDWILYCRGRWHRHQSGLCRKDLRDVPAAPYEGRISRHGDRSRDREEGRRASRRKDLGRVRGRQRGDFLFQYTENGAHLIQHQSIDVDVV